MKRISEQTLYEILEVPQDATGAVIEAACARALALYGPGSLATYTLMSAEEAALLTRRIEEAKATLLDPGSRSTYDESLRRGPAAPAEPGPAAPPGAATEPPAAEDAEAAPVPGPILLEREVAASAPASPPAEPVIPEGGPWTGDVLRRVREARGITVRQIADRTKVTRHHIENIEDEKFSALPAPVYLRGILLSIARELRLDGQKVARSYLDRAAEADGAGSGRPR